MTQHAISRLESIMNDLREKCPWDKKQTIHTLRQLTIEECHELADVITDENWQGIKEELGDILLHIIFYAKIGTEQQKFTLDDVIHGVCEKLIYRHPHIYGDVVVKDEEDVKRNWENLKLKEGKTSILSGVPNSLPSITQAMRLQEKAKQVGFEWENKEQVWEKVNEELLEVEAEVENYAREGSLNRVEAELGDLMFSIINYARFLGIDPDNALTKTNKKFKSRFQGMEKIIAERGQQLTDLDLKALDEVWNQVKKDEPPVL
jgi:XTP/dITP diphosphohydrolase